MENNFQYMHRRNFLQQVAVVTAGLGLGFTAIQKWYSDGNTPFSDNQFTNISEQVTRNFTELIKWLRTNGWALYLQNKLGVNLKLEGQALRKELTKELDANKLAALRLDEASGYDDFAGNRLLQPGFPAYSLLFHTIASPRVRPKSIMAYPTLQQLDALENYIYAVSDWDQLKALYDIKPSDKLVFAVFAYEFRPAFKTPHQSHADFVYSRTGIARIGTEPHHYDKINRCHTAKPGDPAREKTAAVMPARYGLFIARAVKNEDIALVTTGIYKGEDTKDDRNDKDKVFLQPIRKIFDNDVLVGGSSIGFTEKHISEKLKKLAGWGNTKWWKDRKPQIRESKDLIVQDEKDRHAGSSFLVISKHAPLIRPATENKYQLFFEVPAKTEEDSPYLNRFFTAFCTQPVEDVELLENDLSRLYNKYSKPRNQPLFVNITNRKIDSAEKYVAIPMTKDQQFEHEVDKSYYAPLFEDSICDGKVDVINSSFALENKKLDILPAFSIVTAPDFFPQVDPLDLAAYDITPGLSNESHFYEGGVASLATARIKPNPKIIESKNEITKDTYLAVLSQLVKERSGVSSQRIKIYRDPAADRGYDISGFLPDVASSVFAPGWDVTYCKLDNDDDIYIGTEGLGSPFVEDMKFCAALNGMWPATSPDAARTFQGAGEPDYRNPTAVPLLDDELGICGEGPAGKAHESWGWDGEQGPYLEKAGNGWKINFTDLGRSDAISNTLGGKIDLSKLRKLKSSDLIDRMECLKRCIQVLPKHNFRETYTPHVTAFTYLWLVSAEKVNWGNEDAAALGIPENLIGNDKTWITNKANAKVKGPGYLYVFVDSEADNEPKEQKDWAASNLKRRRLKCNDIYVCQVTNDAASGVKIAWGKVEKGEVVWEVG